MTHPIRKDINSEAADWHARLAADDLSEQHFIGFEQWVADPECRAAFDRIQSALFDIEDNKDEIRKALLRSSARAEPGRRIPSARLRKWVAFGVPGGAIATLGALAATFFLILSPHSGDAPDAGIIYAAPSSETRTITLADSTTITLNRGTEIEVFWSRDERRVVLENGEATFDVKHDPDRPMSVISGADVIRDVGTVFNILKDETRLTVTVAEGEVAVIAQAAPVQRVTADFQYQIDHADGSTSLQPVKSRDALAWQEGHLVYRDTALSDIVRDLNRYSRQPIRIADKEAADLRFSGALRIEDVSAMLGTLEEFLPISIRESDGTFIVESRK